MRLFLLLPVMVWGCGQPSTGALQSAFQPEADRIWQEHAGAESKDPWYASLATGIADPGLRPEKTTKHPWPVQLLSIGHTMASYQNYGGSPYFHHGLDIRADAGSDVIASAGGRVVNIENYVPGNAAYWEVAILDDEGYLWQYHHVDRWSIPQAVWDAYRSGSRVVAGEKIGEVYYWSSQAFGELFHHIHLNVLGEGSQYLNPFAFLDNLDDDQGPDIVEVGLTQGGRRLPGNSVSGTYSLSAKVHDLILHDRFVVPVHSLQYSIDGSSPVDVWRFDSLPGGSSNSRHVQDYFVSSLTCGNYNCRELTVDLSFSTSETRRFPQDSGVHQVEVIATDFSGNQSRQVYEWDVR